eukprot:TRINITY_DN25426_c0_g2_i1.p1 TRINITY_DN25426_c0_g2~~TRINITY_DN25426_c0_g2_i1.p1  ORF type:complete len:982 (+),score=228.21 TRINITY_DN25426_c0_g2_i1:48-2948(+)
MADRSIAQQRSAPQTPQRAAHSHADAATPEPQRTAPTAQQMFDLSELTREAISEGLVEQLSDQAQKGQICGALLELEEVTAPRRRAIDWLSRQFDSFGFRDEWLADAILIMDRVAVLAQNSEAARKAMENQDLWLGAVQVALKMCEAESELDSSLQDLVVPLVPFAADGPRCTRQRWSLILKAELCIAHALDFDFVVPTALQLVQHIAAEMCAATRADRSAALGSPGEAVVEEWPGLAVGHLPYLVGPPLKSKEMEEQRFAMALPKRPLCRFQALACFLTELAIVHAPGAVYGDKMPTESLAVTALQLALHSFESQPPEACKAFLSNIKARLLPPERLPEMLLQNLFVSVYQLWSKLPADSPVLRKWQKRQIEFTLPPAPTKAQLPNFMQQKCIFSTPQRRQAEERDFATTPCKPGHAAGQVSPGQVGTQESEMKEAKSDKCTLLPDEGYKGSSMQAPASPKPAPAETEVVTPVASPKSTAETVIDSSSPSQASVTPGSGGSAPASVGVARPSNRLKPFGDRQRAAQANEKKMRDLKKRVFGTPPEAVQAPAQTLHLQCSKADSLKRRRLVIQPSPPAVAASGPSDDGEVTQGISLEEALPAVVEVDAGISRSEPSLGVMDMDTGISRPEPLQRVLEVDTVISQPEPLPAAVEVDPGISRPETSQRVVEVDTGITQPELLQSFVEVDTGISQPGPLPAVVDVDPGISRPEPLHGIVEVDTGFGLPQPDTIHMQVDTGSLAGVEVETQQIRQVQRQPRPLAPTADLLRCSLQEGSAPVLQPAQPKVSLSSKLRLQAAAKMPRKNPDRASKSRFMRDSMSITRERMKEQTTKKSTSRSSKAVRRGPEGAVAPHKAVQRLPCRTSDRQRSKDWIPIKPFAVERRPSIGEAGNQSGQNEQQGQQVAAQWQVQRVETPPRSPDIDDLAWKITFSKQETKEESDLFEEVPTSLILSCKRDVLACQTGPASLE